LGLTNLKEMGANSLIGGKFFYMIIKKKIGGIFFKLGANVLVEFEKKILTGGIFF